MEHLLAVTMQLCAALASKASRADQPLVHDAVAVPHDFSCPIRKVIMIDPYMLETGHSYEKAAIAEWLEANNTCPVSNKVLKTKDLVRNHALRNSIETWAAKHRVKLGAAPVYTPLFGGQSQPDAAGHQVNQGSHQQPAPADRPGWVVGIGEAAGAQEAPSASRRLCASLWRGKDSSNGSGHGGSGEGAGAGPRAGMFRCTRTRWAITLGLLVLVIAVIAVSVAVVLATKKSPQQPVILPATTPQAQAKGEDMSFMLHVLETGLHLLRTKYCPTIRPPLEVNISACTFNGGKELCHASDLCSH